MSDTEQRNDFDQAADEAHAEEHELCVQMAIRMAGALPNDPGQGDRVLGMVRAIYHTITDLRQARVPLAG